MSRPDAVARSLTAAAWFSRGAALVGATVVAVAAPAGVRVPSDGSREACEGERYLSVHRRGRSNSWSAGTERLGGQPLQQAAHASALSMYAARRVSESRRISVSAHP